MKKIFFVITILCSLLFVACKKDKISNDPIPQNGTITIKAELNLDCTGKYIRYQNKDFKICNIDKIANLPDNAMVTVKVKRVADCTNNGNFPVACLMYHGYESWVEIISVK
jgi:hypothetical protein